MDNSAESLVLTGEVIRSFDDRFHGPMDERANLLAQSALTRFDTATVLTVPGRVPLSHVFSHKVSKEGKPVTSQKSSGRCWIFAALNVARLPYGKSIGVDDFEFSQCYLHFWDKVERSNYVLTSFVEVLRRGDEPVDGRLVQHLLTSPANDGGQWDMLVNLIEKYGLVPKKVMPDSYLSENSLALNRLINNKVREFCCRLHDMSKSGASVGALQAEQRKMMELIYKIASICLGSAPKQFTFEYYDSQKVYHSLGPLTPLEFYLTYVKPCYDFSAKICLTNDPRPENPYYNLYTVEFLNNVVGARKVLYINLPIDLLKQAVMRSIQADEAVWFGCDVGKEFSRKSGTLDIGQFDYAGFFNTGVLGLTKAQRLHYHESEMTHAMVFTALSVEDETKTAKWRVENSWGEDFGDKGYLVMSDKWFDEFVYEVAIDRKYLPSEILAIESQEVRVLPAWDPMGALA